MKRRTLTGLAVAASALIGLGTSDGHAAALAPAYSGSYTLTSFGSPAGVPAQLGGITFLNNNTLLIGGSANTGAGAIYSATVTRDATTQLITGIGPATLYASAPNIDGGLAFGPGGVLFYSTFSDNKIGQILPGSTAPDLVQTMPGPFNSLGTLQFVPPGAPGAGNLVVGSYSLGVWGVATLTQNPNGTYAISGLTAQTSTPGGPEGIVYVPTGSPGFTGDKALVSLYDAGRVDACNVNAAGLPVTGSCTPFITGLGGAEGAVLDPVTNAFLFSTFGAGNQIVMVSGFARPPEPPTGVPEPATAMLLGAGLLGLAGLRARRRPDAG